ncbi:protein CEBPZOS isoform X2 [Camelus bactrianus]|uniref:Protein CEBPZOS isoform X2 n=1 Tax=Camelus bactrianus TaxID=9837 RepID=A0AC58RJX4_CAMBA
MRLRRRQGPLSCVQSRAAEEAGARRAGCRLEAPRRSPAALLSAKPDQPGRLALGFVFPADSAFLPDRPGPSRTRPHRYLPAAVPSSSQSSS